jgi:hypothetical protein
MHFKINQKKEGLMASLLALSVFGFLQPTYGLESVFINYQVAFSKGPAQQFKLLEEYPGSILLQSLDGNTLGFKTKDILKDLQSSHVHHKLWQNDANWMSFGYTLIPCETFFGLDGQRVQITQTTKLEGKELDSQGLKESSCFRKEPLYIHVTFNPVTGNVRYVFKNHDEKKGS